jgi:hypothetical protein
MISDHLRLLKASSTGNPDPFIIASNLYVSNMLDNVTYFYPNFKMFMFVRLKTPRVLLRLLDPDTFYSFHGS